MLHRTLLAMALIASAGAVHAQTANPVDPYGRPLLGRNDWVRQTGDQPGPSTGVGAGMTTTTTTMPAAPMTSTPMTGSVATMPPATTAMPMQTTAPAAGEPLDPYGRPLVGRNDWVRQPGDQKGTTGMTGTTSASIGSAMPSVAAGADANSQIGSGPHPVAFKDEFGFRYDAMGNRLDARGYVISPQTK